MVVGAVAALALLGCPGDLEPNDRDTAGEAEAPLAAPTVAVAGASHDGAFLSTCSAGLALAEPNGNAVSGFYVDPFDGGLWGAVGIDPSRQLVATLTWDACEYTEDGTGSFLSSTFSGEAGDLFVLHYDGIDGGFVWMVQREDFVGGSAHAKLAEGADEEAFGETVKGLGAATIADAEDPNFRWIRWGDDQSVASVLYALTITPEVSWAEPEWIERPAWW